MWSIPQNDNEESSVVSGRLLLCKHEFEYVLIGIVSGSYASFYYSYYMCCNWGKTPQRTVNIKVVFVYKKKSRQEHVAEGDVRADGSRPTTTTTADENVELPWK